MAVKKVPRNQKNPLQNRPLLYYNYYWFRTWR
jgi:hypothetical protein